MDKTAGLDLHVLTDLVLVLDVFDQVFASFKTWIESLQHQDVRLNTQELTPSIPSVTATEILNCKDAFDQLSLIYLTPWASFLHPRFSILPKGRQSIHPSL